MFLHLRPEGGGGVIHWHHCDGSALTSIEVADSRRPSLDRPVVVCGATWLPARSASRGVVVSGGRSKSHCR